MLFLSGRGVKILLMTPRENVLFLAFYILHICYIFVKGLEEIFFPRFNCPKLDESYHRSFVEHSAKAVCSTHVLVQSDFL